MSKQTPPTWAPNAIATASGWADPKTKELLVAQKGLVVSEVKETKLSPSQQVLGEVYIPEVNSTEEIIGEKNVSAEESKPTDKKSNIRKGGKG